MSRLSCTLSFFFQAVSFDASIFRVLGRRVHTSSFVVCSRPRCKRWMRALRRHRRHPHGSKMVGVRAMCPCVTASLSLTPGAVLFVCFLHVFTLRFHNIEALPLFITFVSCSHSDSSVVVVPASVYRARLALHCRNSLSFFSATFQR